MGGIEFKRGAGADSRASGTSGPSETWESYRFPTSDASLSYP
jgi:hypothetical protein